MPSNKKHQESSSEVDSEPEDDSTMQFGNNNSKMSSIEKNRIDPAFLKQPTTKADREDSDNDGELFAQDASNGLSYEKQKYTVNRRHPRKVDLDDNHEMVYKKYPICGTSTGSHSWRKKSRKSDLQEYGVGIVLYFQFLKYIGCMFFLMMVLSIPSYMFYFSGNTSFKLQFKDIVLKFSLGNIGSVEQACNSGSFSQASVTGTTTADEDPVATINLYCSYGKLDTIDALGSLASNQLFACSDYTGKNYQADQQFEWYPETCNYAQLNSTTKAIFDAGFEMQCKDKNTCSLQFRESNLPEGCILPPNTVANYQYIMIATCRSEIITVGESDFTVSKDKVAMVVVIFDLLCSFVMYFQLLALKKHQKMVKRDVNQSTLQAPDFSVQLRQNPHKETIEELIPIYWSWAEYILDHEQKKVNPTTQNEDLNRVNLANVNIGLSNYGYLNYYQKMAKLLKKKKYYDSKVKQTQNKDVAAKYQEKIDQLQRDSKKILQSIESYKAKHKPDAIYIYLQFQSMNGKEQFLDAFNKYGKCKRCCINTCGVFGKKEDLEHKYLAGYWPQPKTAPDPSLILWQNLGVGRLNRFCRQVFVYIISFLIVCGSFAAIIYSYQLKESTNEGFNAADCGNVAISQGNAESDYAKDKAEQQGTWQCYCYQQFTNTQFAVADLEFSDGSKPCGNWLQSYTITLTIIYGISVFITALNGILRLFLRCMSKYERAHTITEQLASSSSKMWIVQFVNTAIVLLLINAEISTWRVPDGLPILNGNFTDFTAEWYATVGTTIAFSMMFGSILPFTNFLFCFQKRCVACLDRGCSSDQRRTKQILQTDYEAKYIGSEFQIENRYAQIIAITYITLLYSTAIPFLYFAAFISVLSMYWSDKILFLRNWRTPPLYSNYLATTSRNLLKHAILIHLCFGFYMLSNPQFFAETSDDSDVFTSTIREESAFIFDWIHAIFGVNQERFYQQHTIVYLAGIVLFLIVYLLEEIFGLMSRLVGVCCCCFGKEEDLSFSIDIFKEMSVERLQHEYDQCKVAGQTTTQDAQTNNKSLIMYFIQRLSFKLRQLKIVLARQMTEGSVKDMRDTKANFKQMFVAKKNDFSHRMKSSHSYNILDSPSFIESQKIEKRIVRYNAARKSKDLTNSKGPQKFPTTENRGNMNSSGINKQISVTDDRFNYSYNPNASQTNNQNVPTSNQFAQNQQVNYQYHPH